MGVRKLSFLASVLLASLPCPAQQSADFLPAWTVDEAGQNGMSHGDWNGDGRTDLIAYSELDGRHTLTVFAQRPDGRLLPARPYDLPLTGERRRLHAVRDLDGDGRAELIFMPVPGWMSTISIVPQDSTGAPANTAIDVGPVSNWTTLTYTDPNRDGRWDLLAFSGIEHTTLPGGEIWTFAQTSPLTFTVSQTGSSALSPAVRGSLFANINGDSYPDLVINGEEQNHARASRIRFGDASNSYAAEMVLPAQDEFSQPFAVADIDGNGLPDILYESDSITILYQTDPLVFTGVDLPIDAGNYAFRSAAYVADIDNDGDLDILGLNDSPGYLYRQAPNGTFPVAEAGYFIRYGFSSDAALAIVADLNNDGYADIANSHNAVRIAYSSHGTYPYLDASLTVTASHDVRDDGTLVDYVLTVRNVGPAPADSGELSVTLQPDMRFAGSSGACDVYLKDASPLYIGSSRIGCKVPNLAAGASAVITIQARSVITTDDRLMDISASIESSYTNDDRLDINDENNSADLEYRIVPGHRIDYGASFDRVFAAEESQQLSINALRQTTGIGDSGTWLKLTHITTDASDIAAYFNQAVFWQDADMGHSRALIPLAVDSTVEGKEQLRIDYETGGTGIPGFPPRSIIATIFDDRPDLSSAGVRPTEQSPDYIESVQVLTVADTPGEYMELQGMAIADINGDGHNDLIALKQLFAVGSGASDSASLYIFPATNQGKLDTPPDLISVGVAACCLAVGDINGDQLADIVVGVTDGVQFYLQSALHDLQFDHQLNGRAPSALRMKDMDGDGLNDLVVLVNGDGTPGNDNVLTVYRQSAAGQLVPVYNWTGDPGATSAHLALGDIDRNGLIDIAIGQGLTTLAPVTLLLQSASGVFESPVIRNPAGTGRPLAPESLQIADVDHDGDRELVVYRYVYDFVNGALNDGLRELWDASHFFFSRTYIDGNGTLDELFWPGVSQAPGLRRWVDEEHFESLYPGIEWDRLNTAPSIDRMQTAVGDIGSDGSIDIAVTVMSDPQLMILSAFPQQSELLLDVLTEPADIVQGDADEMVLRVTNIGTRGTPESVLRIGTTDALVLDALLPAAGSCAIRQLIFTEAECTLPSLDAGGHVDIAIDWTGGTPAAGTLTASLATRFGALTPGQTDVTRSVTVAVNPNPPPPTPPPPAPPPIPRQDTGGGGGNSDWLLLLGLLIASQFESSRPVRRRRQQAE